MLYSKTSLACTVRERFNMSRVEKTAAVKNGRCNFLPFGASGNFFSNRRRTLARRTARRASRICFSKRYPPLVVNKLRVDIPVGLEYRKSRPLFRPRHSRANPSVTDCSLFFFGFRFHMVDSVGRVSIKNILTMRRACLVCGG